MVTHVAYIEEHFHSAGECLRSIREHVDLGWQIAQIRGARNGPYAVVFRMDEGPS